MSPKQPQRVEARIVSDGTPQHTQVLIGDQELHNVQHVTWDLDVGDDFATATITLGLVDVDVRGHAHVQPGPSPSDRRPPPPPSSTPRHRPST